MQQVVLRGVRGVVDRGPDDGPLSDFLVDELPGGRAPAVLVPKGGRAVHDKASVHKKEHKTHYRCLGTRRGARLGSTASGWDNSIYQAQKSIKNEYVPSRVAGWRRGISGR